jgi:hypothetical protein
MTEASGTDIIDAVRNVRRFLEDVGKLLTTASEYLRARKWIGVAPLVWTDFSSG